MRRYHDERSFDDPNYWDNEGAYFQGLGGDAGEETTMLPSNTSTVTAPPSQQDKPWYETLVSSLTSTVLPAAAAVYQQKKLTDINVQRLRAGLQPLSPSQAQALVPQAQVTVGPDATTKKLLIGAAAVGGGLVLLRAFKVI
jgi:hypothetical protein